MARRSWIFVAALLAWSVPAAAQGHLATLAPDLAQHIAQNGSVPIQVIVQGPQSMVDRLVRQYGVTLVKRLRSGAVLSGLGSALAALATDSQLDALPAERMVEATQTVDTEATGASQAWPGLLNGKLLSGQNGAGIGVALVDSGVAVDHPDFGSRVIYSLDFVDPNGKGADLYGHGTHVAGIIAGAGTGSQGLLQKQFAGAAPGAQLINLRVLDGLGMGLVSDVVDAIDWCIANKAKYNIRIINLSLGHLPVESEHDDPLAQAVERAVASGIVVVTSAGNYGKLADGTPVLGGIVTPGIAPHVITVGAVNTRGTIDRSDDLMATWSSRGPAGDPQDKSTWIIKPDLVAPGNAVVSAMKSNTYLWNLLPDRQVTTQGGGYLKLSGTSMATPFVSGAVALLLQAGSHARAGKVRAAAHRAAARWLRVD
jgi:serine protease AprX